MTLKVGDKQVDDVLGRCQRRRDALTAGGFDLALSTARLAPLSSKFAAFTGQPRTSPDWFGNPRSPRRIHPDYRRLTHGNAHHHASSSSPPDTQLHGERPATTSRRRRRRKKKRPCSHVSRTQHNVRFEARILARGRQDRTDPPARMIMQVPLPRGSRICVDRTAIAADEPAGTPADAG
jgi:hypothetical protein